MCRITDHVTEKEQVGDVYYKNESELRLNSEFGILPLKLLKLKSLVRNVLVNNNRKIKLLHGI